MKTADVSIMYRSTQPFWQASRLHEVIIRDNEQVPVAFVYDLALESETLGLSSVPGTGLICLCFSLQKEKSQVICCGALSKRKFILSNQGELTFNCHFFPGQFTRVFGIPARLVTDQEIPLNEILNIGTLAEEIASATDFQERVTIIERMIHIWAARTKESLVSRTSRDMVYQVLTRRGDMRVKDIEQQIGFSSRYLQQITQEQIGVPPKILLDNIRFQCALRLMLHAPSISLANLAQQTGFYDQAHFAKTFKEMTGMPPAAFLKEWRAQFYKI